MKSNSKSALLLGANFCGNVGDLYILDSLYSFLVENGYDRIDICPYPKQNNRRISQVNSNNKGVRLVEPKWALRSVVERLMRASPLLERVVSKVYFSSDSFLIKRVGADFDIDCYDRVIVLGGELDVPYSLLDTHSYLRKINNTRLVYSPISVPFDKSKVRFLRERFSEVEEVAVRDPATFDWLVSNGINNIRLVPDTAFLSYRQNQHASLSGSVGICLHSRWGYDLSIDGLVDGIVSSVIGQGGAIVFFATNLDEDYRVVEKLKDRYLGVFGVSFELPESIDDLSAVVSGMDLIISDRLHAIIVSLIKGTSVLPLSTRSKVLGYCKYIGVDRPLQITTSKQEIARIIELATSEAINQRFFVERAHQAVRSYFLEKLL